MPRSKTKPTCGTICAVALLALAGVVCAQENNNADPEPEACPPDTLFEPYVTTKDSGLGMGLSISRTIIEGHGGRLWFEPQSTGGACLAFRLPMSRGEGDD